MAARRAASGADGDRRAIGWVRVKTILLFPPTPISMATMLCNPISRAVRWLSTTALCGIISMTAGCSQDVTSPDTADGAETLPEPSAGVVSFTGRWGGQAWEGDAGALLFPDGAGGGTLYVVSTAPVDAGFRLKERLRIGVIFDGVGSYTLNADNIDIRQLVGGDGIIAIYDGSGPEAGVMHITSFDEASGEMEGTVTFDAVSSSGHATHGPAASFENGQFRASVTVRTRTD